MSKSHGVTCPNCSAPFEFAIVRTETRTVCPTCDARLIVSPKFIRHRTLRVSLATDANPFPPTITITRELQSAGFADGRLLSVHVDGKRIDRIRPNETIRWHVSPGRHDIRIGMEWSSSPECLVEVEPGDDVRLSGGFSGGKLAPLVTWVTKPKSALWLSARDDSGRDV